jgi:hypothetical protein
MTKLRHFDTVAFDVRDDAEMLFFADTQKSGDINSYLLLMRASDDELNDTLYLEMDETQLAGKEVVRRAELDGNLLRLTLYEDAGSIFGDTDLVLTFDDNEHNRAGIQHGALRVLGDLLVGGHT